MKLLEEIKNLGYKVTLNGEKIKLIYHGEGEPDRDKVLPLITQIKKFKPLIIDELKKDLCQHCLTKQWQRLCWGTHARGKTGWGSFCLTCEPYPEYKKQ